MKGSYLLVSIWLGFSTFILLLFIGWLCFSLAAGIIVYLTSLTTNHVHLDPPSVRKAEKTSVMKAHTLDPVIKEPLNAAKGRWFEMLDRNEIQHVLLKSNDNLSLTGYYWQAKKNTSHNTVILVHGMYDSAAGMAYLAEEYHKKECNILSIDLRSHGESEGTKRTMGIRESEDLALWVEYIEKKSQVQKIFLHGVSMGGATVLLYAGNKIKKNTAVKGIISDSSYPSYTAVFLRLVQMIFKNSFVAHSIIWGASWGSFFNTGIFFSEIRPDKALNNIEIPVLLFHGEKDQLVPLFMIHPLVCAKMKPLCELVVVPEAPHIGAYFYAPELYMNKINDFMGRL